MVVKLLSIDDFVLIIILIITNACTLYCWRFFTDLYLSYHSAILSKMFMYSKNLFATPLPANITVQIRTRGRRNSEATVWNYRNIDFSRSLCFLSYSYKTIWNFRVLLLIFVLGENVLGLVKKKKLANTGSVVYIKMFRWREQDSSLVWKEKYSKCHVCQFTLISLVTFKSLLYNNTTYTLRSHFLPRVEEIYWTKM